MKKFFYALTIAAALAACQLAPAGSITAAPQAAVANTDSAFAQNAQSGAIASPNAAGAINADASSNVDLTRLPLGDNLKSTSPRKGYLWPCNVNPGAGGAQVNGPWIKSDGAYDLTAKAVVDGSVKWQSNLQVTLNGNTRVISTNDLPNHSTGTYPIAKSDDAYQYDRNPNRIQSQTFRIELPANPTLAAQPTCAPGAVGMLLTGSSLFNGLDAPGRDAVAHETQDSCGGHPQESGAYHYHNLTNCIEDKVGSDGHSALLGYMIDGFGIYGYHDVGGKILTSADLDQCHGHTHTIEWDGKRVTMYHYHATYDFPYTAGCMRGTYSLATVRAISGTEPGGGNQPPGQSGQPGNNQTPGQNGQQTGNNRLPGQTGQPGNNQLPGSNGGQQPGNQPPGQNGGQQLGNQPPGQNDAQRPDLAAAAAKLGVTEQQLRDALGPPQNGQRPDLASAASKLRVTEAQLRAALGAP